MKRANQRAHSARGHVAETLREAIISGELPAGTQLRQDRLSADFATSAAPVREALRELESEGLVVHYSNRGSFVAEITDRDLREVLLPIRLHLERHALERAIERDHERLCAALDEVVTEMRIAAERRDVRAVTETDVRFHRALVELSGSVQTIQLWSSIQGRLRIQFYRLGRPHERLRSIVDEHTTLLGTVRHGSLSEIHTALHEHIVRAADELLDAHGSEWARSNVVPERDIGVREIAPR